MNNVHKVRSKTIGWKSISFEKFWEQVNQMTYTDRQNRLWSPMAEGGEP